MKRISLLMILAMAACALPRAQAQDAATEERLNQLNGKLDNIIEAQRSQQKQIDALAKDLEALREQVNRPSADAAVQEELKRIWKALEDVDHKRIQDAEKTASLLKSLGQKVAAAPVAPRRTGNTAEKTNEKGFPYTIQQGDTLSVLVQAYKEKNIKVSVDQILKANPGLDEKRLQVGQKIWIPAPE